MRRAAFLAVATIFFATSLAAQQPTIDSSAHIAQLAKELRAEASQKPDGLATRPLQNYGNHLTMLAFRNKSGAAELHQHYVDFFFVVDGSATLVTGGKIANEKTVSDGEIRGTSIEGGEQKQIGKGDVVHIPQDLPHQLLLHSGDTFTYFVVKVLQ
jgi:mannose-6-phosphate isomerase-like protein (cupin superfamily)